MSVTKIQRCLAVLSLLALLPACDDTAKVTSSSRSSLVPTMPEAQETTAPASEPSKPAPTEPSPSMPTGPAAISNLGAEVHADRIVLTWDSAPDATSYDLYFSIDSPVNHASTKVPNVNAGYLHAGLAEGTTYHYLVTAVNANGETDSDELVVRTKVNRTYAYAAAQYTNKIWQFSIAPDTGALVPLTEASVDAQDLPMITTITASGRQLLAINYNSHSLSSYAIARDTGALTLIQHQSMSAGSAPAWVVSHRTRPVAYVANSGLAKITVIDIADDGKLAIRNSVDAGAGVTCLVVNAAGSLIYSVDQGADRIGIYGVDQEGDLTFVRSVPLPTGAAANQATLSPDGRFLYVANWSGQSISGFAVIGDDLASLGAPVSVGAGVYTVTVSPDGRRLFAAMPYGNAYSEHALDAETGAIGAAQVTTKAGSVNFTFLNGIAYMVSWANDVSAGLPIEMRPYAPETGLATMGASSSDSYKGLYQLTAVTFEVDSD